MPIIQKPKGMGGADVTSFDASGGLEAGVEAGASLLTPLISIYKDKAAREAATQEFIQSVKSLANSDKLTQAAQWLAEKYPRVAAHMRMSSVRNIPELPGGFETYAALGVPAAKVKAPMPLYITSAGMDRVRGTGGIRQAQQFLSHEATHAAQALGNSDMQSLYNAVDYATGYMKNPFETSARIAEQNIIKPSIAHQPVTPALEQLATSGDGPLERYLKGIMTRRLGRLPMAKP